MKSFKLSFPLVHKTSVLPNLALVLGVLGSLPMLMVLWEGILSQFTRLEANNLVTGALPYKVDQTLYLIYVWVKAITGIVAVASLAVYTCKRASAALLPPCVLGIISAVIKLIIVMTDYTNRKALNDSMHMNASYTQNYINIAEAAMLLITVVAAMIYLLGFLKTGFPVILLSVLTTIFVLYSVISYAGFEVGAYSVLCRCYAVALCPAIICVCLSSKTKKQISGTTKYQPRRMRK